MSRHPESTPTTTTRHGADHRRQLLRWLLTAGFWALLLAITTLSLLPVAYLPPQAFSIWDKAQHALAFAALAVAALLAYPRHPGRVLLGLLLYGGAIELAQAATGWRYGEWSDWLADAVGLAAGALLAWGGRRPTERSRTPAFIASRAAPASAAKE